MVIYTHKVDALITSIQNKNIQDIVDKQTYIPSLGKVNSVSQVQNWLNKRVNYLNDAKNLSETQVQTFVDNYYNSLTLSEKAQADIILAGGNPDYVDEAEWEKLVLFNIYYFITTEEY